MTRIAEVFYPRNPRNPWFPSVRLIELHSQSILPALLTIQDYS